LTQPERIKIAQELHDGIAQDLVALSYSLDLLLAQADTPASTRVELRKLIFSVSTMIKKVRQEIFALRATPSQSFESSLRTLLAESQSSIELKLSLFDYQLSDHVDAQILAISRELLRNSIKHSGASVIEIAIEKSENGTTYSYRDNGKGINSLTTSGFGIQGIKERCLSIESELTVASDNLGTHYLISIPS
jgi:NarL family two-component system sensor histidine kinase LiaS